MIKAKLTSKELDFMIYISRFQDDFGRVAGIHYKDVCKNMNISYQGFYDVKKSLIKKNFITSTKSNRIDHDITILNNEFPTKESIQEGYINTNHHIFYEPEFFKLKAGAKLLAMEIMKISYAGTGQCKIGTKKFYEKYTKLFKVSNRVMRKYLMSLKPFFSIGIVEGIYYMRPLKKVYRQAGQASENDNYATHNIEVICRRNKIADMDKKKMDDIRIIIRQHKEEAKQSNRSIIELLKTAIEKSLTLLNINHPKKKIRALKPKLIHKILIEELAA